MSLRINHNQNAINAHRNLQVNDQELRRSLEKLSSGLEINRAADGPASLAISEQMRAQIAGLNQAIRNSENAVSVVQTTEGSLNELNRLLISMRQLAIHASNEGVNDEIMLAADQQEIDNSVAAINRIAQQTQFGNKKLLDGSNGANGVATGNGLEFVQASTKTEGSGKDGFNVVVTQVADHSSVTGTAALTDELVNSGETLTIIEGGKSATYTTGADDTMETAMQNLASVVKQNGLKVNVDLTDGKQLRVEHKDYGSQATFQVSSTTAGVLSKAAGNIETATPGQDIVGTINGEAAKGNGQLLHGVAGSKNIDGMIVRYFGDAGQEAEIPETGISVGNVFITQNSLNFQIGGNKGQTAGISLQDTSASSLAKGVANESGYSSLDDIDLTTFQGAQDSLGLIDRAIDDVSTIRAELGAFQKNSLESNLSNLRIANENLTAAESTIRDVDMAQEMAKFTRNQILTESATAMLRHANQVPQSVLKLIS